MTSSKANAGTETVFFSLSGCSNSLLSSTKPTNTGWDHLSGPHRWVKSLLMSPLVALLPVVGALFLFGCGSSSKSVPPTSEGFGKGPTLSDEGMEVYAFDVNDDGQSDYWQVFRKGTGVMVRDRRDLNFNGKADVWRFFGTDGELVREEMDLDFDGQVDMVNHYERGVLVLQELGMNFAGKITVRKQYRDGLISVVEQDTTVNGIMDTWEFYEKGKLVRVGRDTSGDGREDTFVAPSPALMRSALGVGAPGSGVVSHQPQESGTEAANVEGEQ